MAIVMLKKEVLPPCSPQRNGTWIALVFSIVAGASVLMHFVKSL